MKRKLYSALRRWRYGQLVHLELLYEYHLTVFLQWSEYAPWWFLGFEKIWAPKWKIEQAHATLETSKLQKNSVLSEFMQATYLHGWCTACPNCNASQERCPLQSFGPSIHRFEYSAQQPVIRACQEHGERPRHIGEACLYIIVSTRNFWDDTNRVEYSTVMNSLVSMCITSVYCWAVLAWFWGLQIPLS